MCHRIATRSALRVPRIIVELGGGLLGSFSQNHVVLAAYALQTGKKYTVSGGLRAQAVRPVFAHAFILMT